MPPPPGKTSATSHTTPFGAGSPVLSRMLLRIQPGHGMVAKPSFWKPAVQSSLHWAAPVESEPALPVTVS